MTEQMKEFLYKLADLMEEYKVDVEGTSYGYDGGCDGIEFTTMGDYCTVELCRLLDHAIVRKAAHND